MTRLPSGALFLVCLLAVGMAAVPAVTAAVEDTASGPSVTDATSTADQVAPDNSSYTSPDSGVVTNEGYESASLNLGAAVQADAQTLRAEHDRRVFEAALEGAGTDSARAFVAEQRYELLETRYERLDEREQALIDAYGTGALGSELFLSELASLRTALDTQVALREQARAQTSTSVPERVRNLEGALAVDTPVVDRVAEAQRSVGNSEPVYILTGEEFVSLATVSEGRFLRQATIHSGRDLTVGTDADQFRAAGSNPLGEASNRAAELYPLIYEEAPSESVNEFPQLPGDSKVYVVTATYTEGVLQAYLDGATTDVFHEIHEQPLNRIEVSARTSVANGTLNVTVGRTSDTGPMRVTATNSQSGLPIQGATVSVGETELGTTDAEGQLWGVEPSGPAELIVTTDTGDRVVVDL